MKNGKNIHPGRATYWIIAAIALCAAPAGLWAQARVAYDIQAVVSISPTTRADAIAWLDKNGGYFVQNTTGLIVAKVPVAQVQGFKKVLESLSRGVLSYTLSSRSIEEEYRAAKAAIDSREAILKSTIGFIGQANVKGALALEQETSAIIGELEQYKGSLKVLENQTRFAQLRLSLQAPEASQIAAVPSSFAWINEIDFYSFMGKKF